MRSATSLACRWRRPACSRSPRRGPSPLTAKDADLARVAADIAAHLHGTEPPPPYDGAGHCYLEFGGGRVAMVEANFFGGPQPMARVVGPSAELAANKQAFAAERRERWFGG